MWLYYRLVLKPNDSVGPTVSPPIGIGVYPQALAGLPEIWTLSMGYFSNPDISDI